MHNLSSRRKFLTQSLAAGAVLTTSAFSHAATADSFKLRYMLASSMYGKIDVLECVKQVSKIGATTIDLWPPSHGDQRLQIDKIGHDTFLRALADADVTFEMSTRYDLGPFRLKEEIGIVKKLGGSMIVCGSTKQQAGSLKEQIASFLKALQPHAAIAEAAGVRICIENHSSALINSPDSLRYFADLNTSPALGIALAPYHLPQDTKVIADLIGHLDSDLAHFYAWEHGMGCHKAMPKPLELMQMPGRGTMDFAPLCKALAEIKYDKYTEIFMHPTPRGIPILEDAQAVSEEINVAREYLSRSIARANV